MKEISIVIYYVYIKLDFVYIIVDCFSQFMPGLWQKRNENTISNNWKFH